ncbi:MAG: L,D-transpeptidase family protein [Nocardioidaceae bacterium]|nr:L,D-transpeptidase family protein [Nocardioidaceae bacterium]
MSGRGTRSRLTLAVTAASMSLVLAACSGDSTASPEPAEPPASRGAANPDAPAEQEPPTSEAVISANVEKGADDVAVDTAVAISVTKGTFDSVVVRDATHNQKVAGSLNEFDAKWTADDLLESGTRYVVSATATDSAGLVAKTRTRFSTEDLSLDQQTYPNIIPLQGETVGVGMPVIVQFDIPVANRADFERRMHVSASPSTVGSWHWMSDDEVHWRPKSYWHSGTEVDVHLDLNSVDAGNGIYGQVDRDVSFTVGRSVVMRADLDTLRMPVFVGGEHARTLEITAGKQGFRTRSGTKLIMEKFESKRFDAATVGIERGDPEYYNIPRVQYAQRLTFSGEFIHAAPWSVDDQGERNASHGCVGINTQDAAWLFGLTHRGDPMEVTGTVRRLEKGNGWTDWNQSFAEYKAGSAL